MLEEEKCAFMVMPKTHRKTYISCIFWKNNDVQKTMSKWNNLKENTFKSYYTVSYFKVLKVKEEYAKIAEIFEWKVIWGEHI